MFYIVTYDIETSVSGQARLRKVAKLCEQYGIRVQNSVFEMELSSSEMILLKDGLKNILDLSCDSLRIYTIGKKADTKIEVFGKRNIIEISSQDAFFL